MYLDVKINNVPVQLEVKNVGPASLEDIDEFREKLKSGKLILVEKDGPKNETSITSENPYFINDEVKDEVQKEEPNLPEEVKEASPQPSLSNVISVIKGIPEIVDDVKEIFENNKDPEKKPWYKSKTIISNSVAAVGCILGALVSDHPEASMYFPASVLAVINLFLRVSTTGKIQIPLEKQIDKLRKK